MNKARPRLFSAVIAQGQFAIASRSAAPIATARQWQEGVRRGAKRRALVNDTQPAAPGHKETVAGHC